MNTQYQDTEVIDHKSHASKVKLSFLGKVSTLINSTLEIKELLKVIMESAKDMLDCESSSLLLMDEDKQQLRFDVVTGEKEVEIKEIFVPIGQGIAGIVAKNEEPLIVNDAQTDERIYRKVDEHIHFTTKNLIAVPMKVKAKLIGVLEGINKREGSFNSRDMFLLSYLADQAAIAINNRELFENLRKANKSLARRVEEFKALYEIGKATNFVENIDDLIDKAIQTIVKILKISRCSIQLFNESSNCLVIRGSSGISEDVLNELRSISIDQESISSSVFKKQEAVLVKDISKDPFYSRIAHKMSKSNSFLSVPLISENQSIGIIHATDKNDEDDKVFNDLDLQLLSSIGNHIATTYKTLQFKLDILEKEKLEKEVETAKVIQEKILPKTFPDDSMVEFAAVSYPAKTVGGDFYDILTLDENKYGIVIADVSGKGIPAALFMALSRNAIRSIALNNASPKAVLKNSNLNILKDSEGGMFVTSSYFVIDVHNRIITFASAGHDPQMLYSGKSKSVQYLKPKGVPLGVFPDSEYEEKVIMYEPGDTLVLFTDGVTEAMSPSEEQFGEKRLVEIVNEYAHLSAKSLISVIEEKVDQFRGNADQYDDFTLFIVHFKEENQS